MSRCDARVRAFTIVEVFSVVMLIGILIILLLPAVQSAREMARRTSCANNLTQVALGVHAYHSSYRQLPTPLSGTDGSLARGQDNNMRLSIFVAMLPYLGSPELYERISHPLDRSADAGWMDEGIGIEEIGMVPETDVLGAAEGGDPWGAWGPETDTQAYHPWNFEVQPLRCPSDPGIGQPAFGRTNYAACLGDGVMAADSGPMKEVRGVFVVDDQLQAETDAAMRGMFVPRVAMRLKDTIDGLSNTIMLGEMATDLGDQDIRTYPLAGPGANVLRDQPTWARDAGLIDLERPQFWASGRAGGRPAATMLPASSSSRRGHRWADGMPLFTGITTILPPNREITMRGDCDDCWGMLPPSSRHQGGAQIAFGDGAVRFISNTIDAGRSSEPTVYLGSRNVPGSPSPYGLWGALGTRASGELESNAFGSKLEQE